jgi:hypothetical protein
LINSDWSEEKKQQYIREKSIFSFESQGYQQALNIVNSKKEKLDSGEKFGGRDVFFSEGF